MTGCLRSFVVLSTKASSTVDSRSFRLKKGLGSIRAGSMRVMRQFLDSDVIDATRTCSGRMF